MANNLEDRLRGLEIQMSAHIADCTQYRKSTEAALGRIEDTATLIKNHVSENNKKLTEHLSAHASRRSTWTDFRVILGVIFGSGGVIWAVVATFLK